LGIKVTIKSNMPKNVSSAKKEFNNSVNRYLDRVGTYFKGKIQLHIQASPPTGRTYTHDSEGEKRSKPHIASSKGNPPRIDTGSLFNSVQYIRTKDLEGEVSVATRKNYAETLEMELDRPFMGQKSMAYKNTLKFGKARAKEIGIK
tara:strand:- start:5594 stop:6031 length:438 start_codon:yes stop_codon:yes gene_type:complete